MARNAANDYKYPVARGSALPLAALEPGWALLEEGLDALGAVASGLEDHGEVKLVAQGLVQRQLDAVVHGLLGVAQTLRGRWR